MNRSCRRAARRELERSFLGLTVVERVLECSECGEMALHIEMWEGDDEPHGLPLSLGRCDCGGFWLPPPLGRTSMGGDA